MKYCRLLLCGLLALAASFTRAEEKRTALTADQKTFLTQYEAVRASLAADDLAATKKAASALATTSTAPDAAKKIAEADSLPHAREAFKIVSKQAVAMIAGQAGYYHAHCPMVPKDEGDWVQTTKKISNPYFGKSMATCGSIEN